MLKKKYLQVKVLVVHILIRLHIIPNVWYQCEIDLAEIVGKEWGDFFKNYHA